MTQVFGLLLITPLVWLIICSKILDAVGEQHVNTAIFLSLCIIMALWGVYVYFL